METPKTPSFANIKGMLSRDQMKQIRGGCGSGSGNYMCCWTGTSTCSACIPAGSDWTCVSGATLTAC